MSEDTRTQRITDYAGVSWHIGLYDDICADPKTKILKTAKWPSQTVAEIAKTVNGIRYLQKMSYRWDDDPKKDNGKIAAVIKLLRTFGKPYDPRWNTLRTKP